MVTLIPIFEPDEKLNHLVIGLKSMVITIIFFIAYGNRKKENTAKWVVPVIALLTVVNISLAVSL